MDTIRQTLAAPPTRSPYRYGLFSVLDFEPSTRGTMRVDWDGLGCLNPSRLIDDCLDETGPAGTLAASIDCGVPGTVGFSVMSFDDSSIGRDREVSTDRASQKLALTEQYVAETGLIAAMQAGSPTDVTADIKLPKGVADADIEDLIHAGLAQVEMALNARGGEGIIFAQRSLAPFLSKYVKATGSTMRTALGTPVAFLAGWPTGGSLESAIVGVNALVAMRGQVETGNGWDTTINDHAEYAARDYAFGWECDAVYSIPEDIVD